MQLKISTNYPAIRCRIFQSVLCLAMHRDQEAIAHSLRSHDTLPPARVLASMSSLRDWDSLVALSRSLLRAC
jgi:hypothetical protein